MDILEFFRERRRMLRFLTTVAMIALLIQRAIV